MERKQEAIEIVKPYVKDELAAQALVSRLQDAGILHLGYGKAEVDQIVGTFKETFGSTKITPMDRAAANRLANAYSVKGIIQVMKAMKQLESNKYAPTFGSVRQLEEKWVNVMAFLRKQSNQSEVIDA